MLPLCIVRAALALYQQGRKCREWYASVTHTRPCSSTPFPLVGGNKQTTDALRKTQTPKSERALRRKWGISSCPEVTAIDSRTGSLKQHNALLLGVGRVHVPGTPAQGLTQSVTGAILPGTDVQTCEQDGMVMAPSIHPLQP